MLSKILACQRCNLHKNQLPLMDKNHKADIMWVGLSAKKVNSIENEVPLSCNTNSGKIVSRLENNALKFNFYKTNLVKCVPLNSQGKLRYPDTKEMHLCFDNLKYEIDILKPKIIFLLGKDVANFVLKNLNFELPKLDDNYDYKIFTVNNTCYVPVHHPSFITVYRRKSLDNYINSVSNIIFEILSSSYNFMEVGI